MLKVDSHTTQVLEAEIMAIDSLFRRIAERGRKIRNQKINAEKAKQYEETALVLPSVQREQDQPTDEK